MIENVTMRRCYQVIRDEESGKMWHRIRSSIDGPWSEWQECTVPIIIDDKIKVFNNNRYKGTVDALTNGKEMVTKAYADGLEEQEKAKFYPEDSTGTIPHYKMFSEEVKDYFVKSGIIALNNDEDLIPVGDTRYKTPKCEPKTTLEKAEEVIEQNVIYSQARDEILMAQKRQVAYGLDKYPEALNPDSWDAVENINHIIEESVDQLHYLVMLRQKLMQNVLRDIVKETGENID